MIRTELMKQVARLAASLFLLLAIIMLAPGAVSVLNGSQTPKTRWEYRIITMDQFDRLRLKAAKSLPRDATEDDEMVAVLGNLGEEGWELTGYMPDRKVFARFIFKRAR